MLHSLRAMVIKQQQNSCSCNDKNCPKQQWTSQAQPDLLMPAKATLPCTTHTHIHAHLHINILFKTWYTTYSVCKITIYILILNCPYTGFLRITFVYFVGFTSEWYTSDQCQIFSQGLGVAPFHTENNTKTSKALQAYWPPKAMHHMVVFICICSC